jgi:hypothetical protein
MSIFIDVKRDIRVQIGGEERSTNSLDGSG